MISNKSTPAHAQYAAEKGILTLCLVENVLVSHIFNHSRCRKAYKSAQDLFRAGYLAQKFLETVQGFSGSLFIQTDTGKSS